MKYKLIFIDGEYASGCTQIGQQLSKLLHIPCYRADILHIAVMRGHTTPQDLIRLEKTTLNSLLYSVYTQSKAENISGQSESVPYLERKVILELAEHGPCIIVGMGGLNNLGQGIDSFSAFIYSGSESYTDKTVTMFGINFNRRIRKKLKYDRNIVAKHKAISRLHWKNFMKYQMILDGEKLGIDICTKSVLVALERDE